MSRRLSFALAAAITVAVGLSGCVGIPTGGGVQDGGVVTSGDQPDFQFAPEDPVPGSDPEQLLRDFLLALAGPQNGYAIARKFLTSEFSNVWDPEALTTIRVSGSGEIVPAAEGELQYTFSSRAVVDSTGVYSEQPGASNQTLAFSFEKEDGEWRINRAPDGIVLSQTTFDTVFRAQPLYFLDPSSRFLVPDVRWFPLRGTFQKRVAEALLEGPASWLSGGVVITGFPEGTTIAPSEGVAIDAGVATVTLSDAANAASDAQKAAMRQQLAATLGVSTVVLKVGPVTLDSPDVGTPPERPQVVGQPIVGTADSFGFATASGVTALEGFSAQVVSAGASAAAVSRDQNAVALLSPAGVSVVTRDDPPALLDPRPGLIAPTIDPFNFIWSAQGSSAASIIPFGLDDTQFPAIQTAISPDARLISMDVSRDGTRVLLTVIEPLGPRVYVAGVIRDANNVPTSLSPQSGLDVGLGAVTPIDAAWIDERTVAVLAAGEEGTEVSTFGIGGPSSSLGPVEGGTAIVGGNFGADGIRVLAAGQLWQHRASGWLATGIEALYLATQN
jgi:hypothetical protein